MCYGYINEYNEFLNRMQEKQKEMNLKLSEADKKQQDILHYLEFEKCDAVTMVKITKTLKIIRAERRQIKEELEEISKIVVKLGKEAKVTEEKTYTYKTNIMKEIIG